MGGKPRNEWGIHGYDNSLDLCLPPLSLMVFKHSPKRSLPISAINAEATNNSV